MSAIDTLFHQLRTRQQKAFMPFLTAGDPDLDFTCAALKCLTDCGCHMAEVGIPYSDPIADGPVIQASYTRALERHVTVGQIMESLAAVTNDCAMPLVTMVSYAIIYRHGLPRYIDEVQSAGVAGLIVPDLPFEEADRLAALCRTHDLSLIQLITPTTSPERALRIAQLSTGFIYYVSVTGITGQRDELPVSVVDSVGWLREQTDLPICIGFGISRPEHVRMLRPVADGLIVGSAMVRFFERLAGDASPAMRASVLQQMQGFAKQLLSELNPAAPVA